MDLVTGLLIYVSVLLTLIVVVGGFFLLAALRTPPHHASYNEVFATQREAAKQISDALEGPLVEAITPAIRRPIERPY
jgi:hypothetical protein